MSDHSTSDEDVIEKVYHSLDSVDWIRPLDLLLFKGTDTISQFIRLSESIFADNGDFSHIGMVIDNKIMPQIEEMEDGVLYVWESTTSVGHEDAPKDIESGGGRFGVQIRELSKVIESYTSSEGAEVTVCKLIDNPWRSFEKDVEGDLEKRREELISKMEDIHTRLGKRPYEYPIGLVSAAISIARPVRDVVDAMVVKGETIYNYILSTFKTRSDRFVFCSELVAIILKELEMIPADVDPGSALPVDFFGGDKDGIPRVIEDPVYLKM